MGDANGKSGHLGLRLLYVGSQNESQRAERALRRARVEFVRFRVQERKRDTLEGPKPPCLIAGEGRFSGLDSIKRYARVFGSSSS
jgi:hypothetical protein